MSTKSEYLQIRLTPAEKSRLKRLAAAAGQDLSGYVLDRVLPSAQARFAELISLLARDEERSYALAELNDFLSGLEAGALPSAVAHGEVEKLSPFLANYVAAMVEQACRLRQLPPPAWTGGVPPLEEPYFAAPLKSLRLHLLRASPVPFKRRNLFVDSGVGDRV